MKILWRVKVRNPKTGKTQILYSIKPTGNEAEESVLKRVEDRTPIGELPDTPEQWEIGAEFVSKV